MLIKPATRTNDNAAIRNTKDENPMDGIATGFGCGYVFVLLFRPGCFLLSGISSS